MADLIPIIPFNTVQSFFDELKRRPNIRLVKVADQGLVEPVKRGRAVVMQPMVRVVASAFDFDRNEILRWDDKWDVGSGVAGVDCGSNGGRHDDPTGVRTREKIVLECQKRSLQVVRDEEWTPEGIMGTLAGI